jgi:hypothetical protein
MIQQSRTRTAQVLMCSDERICLDMHKREIRECLYLTLCSARVGPDSKSGATAMEVSGKDLSRATPISNTLLL